MAEEKDGIAPLGPQEEDTGSSKEPTQTRQPSEADQSTDESQPGSPSQPEPQPELQSQSPPEPQPESPPQPVGSVPEARAVTKARARDLRALVATYIRRHLPSLPKPSAGVQEPPRQTGTHAAIMPLLKVIPWALLVLFLESFLWDFPGMTLSVFGWEQPLDGLIRILSVGGLIGFFTNWLAITMLFNPRRKRPVFGQGLIPAQRERVIYRLARAVSDELINEEIIKRKIEEAQIIPRYRELAMSVTRGVLEDPDFRSDLKALTGDYVERVLTSDEVRKRIVDFTVEKIESYVGEGVGGLALKAYRFINEDDFKRRIDRAIHQIPGSLDIVLDEMDALLDRVPEKIEARAEDIEQWATKAVLGFVEQLDVYNMIMSNMAQYDERQLEDLLKKTTNEQLNYIKYLGGVLGFVGGFVIWEPLLSLTTLAAVGGLLYGVDEGLMRLQDRREALEAARNPSQGPESGAGLDGTGA